MCGSHIFGNAAVLGRFARTLSLAEKAAFASGTFDLLDHEAEHGWRVTGKAESNHTSLKAVVLLLIIHTALQAERRRTHLSSVMI